MMNTHLKLYLLKCYDLALAVCAGLFTNRLYAGLGINFDCMFNSKAPFIASLDQFGPLGIGTALLFIAFRASIDRHDEPGLTLAKCLRSRAYAAICFGVVGGFLAYVALLVCLAGWIVTWLLISEFCAVVAIYPTAFFAAASLAAVLLAFQ